MKVFIIVIQVLELLWELAHLPHLDTPLMEQALSEHLAILSEGYTVRENVKKSYVGKCIADIKQVRYCGLVCGVGIFTVIDAFIIYNYFVTMLPMGHISCSKLSVNYKKLSNTTLIKVKIDVKTT